MGQYILLSDMRAEVRETADMENGGGPVTDAELNKKLLASVRRLYDRLISARGQEYYRSTVELNVTAGQALYALPADFYKILTVSANEGAVMASPSSTFAASDSGEREGWSLLRPFEMLDLPRLLGRRSSCASETRYRLRGVQGTSGTFEAQDGLEQLELRPVPGTSWTLRLDYLPTAAATLSGGGDLIINGINGFEQACILEVAIYALGKEETDARHLVAQLQAENARIELMASARDHGSPEGIVDTEGLLDFPDPFARGRGGWWP